MSEPWSTKQREAAAEALKSFQEATADRRRSHIWAEPEDGPRVDVTEHVVSLLDMITQSMDWGSDFWTDTDLPSFIELCKLLKFDPPTCAACGQPLEAHQEHA